MQAHGKIPGMKTILPTHTLSWTQHPLRRVLLIALTGLCTVAGVVWSVSYSTGYQTRAFRPAGLDPMTVKLPPARFFADERLTAFSGQGFDLIPDLIVFLDQMEAGADRAAAPTAETPLALGTTILFTNPEVVKFQLYRIQPRDNYWKVAKQFGYTIDTIVGCNPFLQRVTCHSGQSILLPNIGGVLHQVRDGETLDTIALDYAVPADKIQAANLINPQWGVIPEMWIFIPWAKPRYLSESMHKEYSRRALFRSPLAGRYTSFVGMRIHPVLGFSKYHNGVDISCPLNTWVGSSAEGVVIAAGWGGAVGKYVKIDHQNGYATIYGHLNKVMVHQGQRVKRGQLIGLSGATGRVTGPHLHYSILLDGAIKDPMDYLW